MYGSERREPTGDPKDGALVRVAVLLAAAADVRVQPVRDRRSGRVLSDRAARRLDPASARALDLALAFKAERSGVHLSAVLLGPESDGSFLAEAVARGCDQAVRVWDDECREARAPAKAVVLAAAVRSVGADLVLCGAASAVTGSAQVGPLMAAHLGVPCVTQVADLSGISGVIEPPGASVGVLRAVRDLMGGFREEVEVPLPVLLTVLPDSLDPTPGALPRLLSAIDAPSEAWTLADIGVPSTHVRRADESLSCGEARTPRPVLRAIDPPDPAAPAFERIGALVRGTVARREGRLHTGSADDVADRLFQALRDGGWLDHLRQSDR